MRPQNKRPHRLCGEPLCFEAVLQRLFTAYGLTMTWEQYVLVGSTVRSYLSWLCDTGRLEALFENILLLWRKNKRPHPKIKKAERRELQGSRRFVLRRGQKPRQLFIGIQAVQHLA